MEQIKFLMPNRLSNGDIGWAVGYKGLESMGKRQAKDINSGLVDLYVVFTAMALDKVTEEIH